MNCCCKKTIYASFHFKNPVGVVYRAGETNLSISLKNNTSKMLYIIVENMGRLNFGDNLLDEKVSNTYFLTQSI